MGGRSAGYSFAISEKPQGISRSLTASAFDWLANVIDIPFGFSTLREAMPLIKAV